MATIIGTFVKIAEMRGTHYPMCVCVYDYVYDIWEYWCV